MDQPASRRGRHHHQAATGQGAHETVPKGRGRGITGLARWGADRRAAARAKPSRDWACVQARRGTRSTHTGPLPSADGPAAGAGWVLGLLTPGHFRPPMGSGRGCGCRISGPQAVVYLVTALWASHGSPEAFGTLDRMGAAHVGVAREHAKHTMVSLQCLCAAWARHYAPARLQGVGEVRLLPWKRSRQSADEGWGWQPMRAQAHAPPTCMRRSSSLRHMRHIPSRTLRRAARPVATSPSSSCECEPQCRANGWPDCSQGWHPAQRRR
jgi:hypothetical protein